MKQLNNKGTENMKKTQEHYIGQFTLNNEETILTMIRRGNLLIAGGTTNCGLIEEYKFKVDECFTIDENLQAFIEEIKGKE